MKILHVGMGLMPGFARELSKFGGYNFVDWTRYFDMGASVQFRNDLIKLSEKIKPDLTLLHIQRPDVVDAHLVDKLSENSGAVFNWTYDVAEPMPEWFYHIGQNITTLFCNDDDVDEFKNAGLDSDYLQIGYDNLIFKPDGPNGPSADIVFLGNNYSKDFNFPLAGMRRDMVTMLKKEYGESFKVYGNGWPYKDGSLLFKEEKEAACYRGCKIAINFSHFDRRRYTSDRMFRLMGSGAFCLTKWYPEIEKDFTDGVHLKVWHDLDELKKLIDYYLKNDSERNRIAATGSWWVANNCTWTHRMQQLSDMAKSKINVKISKEFYKSRTVQVAQEFHVKNSGPVQESAPPLLPVTVPEVGVKPKDLTPVKIVPDSIPRVPLIDGLFSHDPSMDHNTQFSWDRNTSKYDYTFITDLNVYENTGKEEVIVWLLESPEVTGAQHSYVASNHQKYKYIFTHSRRILESFPDKAKFAPASRCWIKESDQKIWDKSDLVSIIASNKSFASGHALRHQIVDQFKKRIDVYGRGRRELKDKADGLKRYMFSVAIENSKQDYYFTEKLLDCFMTGAVPIYYGCPSIGKFFNTEGIIMIDSVADFEKVLPTLSAERYMSMMPHIIDNFNRCKKYLVAEDFMFENYRDIMLNTKDSPLNSFVDKTYCINLDRRTDRWERMKKIFAEQRIDATRWPAVDGALLTGKLTLSKGATGCLRSHRAVLEDAIKNGYKSICVFEDDLILDSGFNSKLKAAIQSVPKDWDFIYLGCHFHGLEGPKNIMSNIAKFSQAFGIYGVIMKRTVFKSILDVSTKEQIPMDDYITNVQPNVKTYCVMPHLVKVAPDFSDIAGVFCAYEITGTFFNDRM